MDRVLTLEFVRVTETAAVKAGRLMGKGDKMGADQLAVDGMHSILSTVPIDGTVVIGEGEMDEAPMLYIGEKSAPAARKSISPSTRWKGRT